MKYAKGGEVFEWKEFKAFVERLGIDLKKSTNCLTITFPKDDVVRIAQDTRGAGRDFSGFDRHLPENQAVVNVGAFRKPEMPPSSIVLSGEGK